MSESARIRELENALRAAIEHMRTMPLNPMTSDRIRDCERALAGLAPAQYSTFRHLPSGVMLLGLVMSRDGITVKTGDMHIPAQRQRYIDFVYRRLREGIDLPPLKRMGENEYAYPEFAEFRQS